MIFFDSRSRCGRRICSIESMGRYVVSGLAGLVCACTCLPVFFVIYCFGLVVNCDESPYCSRSVGSDPLSLFRSMGT